MNQTLMWEFKTANFTVQALISPEDDLDLSWDDSGEVREKLNDGTYEAFQTEVRVLYRGAEIGADHLGESIYENPRDFFTEHYGIAARSRADGRNYGCYFPDMVREAIKEARKNLANPPRMRA